MTDHLRKAAEMALEALESAANNEGNFHDYKYAANALRQALAQPEQKPVAYLDAVDSKTVYVAPNRKRWLDPHEDKEWLQFHYDHPHDTPLYTAPPSKSEQEPVGFWVYKPALPKGNLGRVMDGDLPWVYDQDSSSGYSARMFVYTAPPKREWEFLGDDEVIALANKEGLNIQVENLPANLLRLRVGALGMAIQKEFWRKNK